MKTRIILATAVVAAVAAGGSSAAHSGTPVSRSCGATTIAGKPWLILAVGVPCSSAKTLIRKLAAKPLPKPAIPGIYPGTYLGMRCRHTPPSLPPSITCGRKGPGLAKIVQGVRRSP